MGSFDEQTLDYSGYVSGDRAQRFEEVEEIGKLMSFPVAKI